jgi:hypothetical protein
MVKGYSARADLPDGTTPVADETAERMARPKIGVGIPMASARSIVPVQMIL